MLNRGPQDHADMKDDSYLEIRKGPELTNDKGQEATSIPGLDSPKLLVWSTWQKNQIGITNLEKREVRARFDGPKLQDEKDADSRTHLNNISGTGLLISLHHSSRKSAHMEIFDVSKKTHIRKIFSFCDVRGVTGVGDVTYNARRNIIGAIPLKYSISYHIFNVGYDSSKRNYSVQLAKKAKWHSEFNKRHSWSHDCVDSFDFHPEGNNTAMATGCKCMISDMNTNDCKVFLELEGGGTNTRCRWGKSFEESLLYIISDETLNILDAEKKMFTLKTPFEINNTDGIAWCLDVCPTDNNIIAVGGEDRVVKIYDRRESKVIKEIGDSKDGEVYSVKWSPKGDSLAKIAYCRKAHLLDFGTGKIIYEEETPYKEFPLAVCLL